MDIARALKILRAKWGTAVLVASLAFVVVLLAPNPNASLKPLYTSKAKVLITPPSGNVRAYGGQAASSTVDFSWFSDPIVLGELLRSEELLERVIEQSQVSLDKLTLADSITVVPLSQGRSEVRLFSLSVQYPDPLVSQKLTRLVTNEFVRYVEDLSAREFANTRRYIEELVVEAESRRDEVETALLSIREKYLQATSDEEIKMQATGLESRLNEAERELTGLQGEVSLLRDYLDGTSASPPWTVLEKGDGSLGTLNANVAERRLELSRLREIYTDQNENVQRAERQLKSAEAFYDQAVRESVESLYKEKAARLSASQGTRSSLLSELNSLFKNRMSEEDRRLIAKYERELEVWEQNHLNLQQQLYQARVVEQSSRRSGAVNVLEQPNTGIVDPANRQAVSQSSVKRALMALPFCLVLGIGAAFAQEYLSSSTKLRPRIEETLELPVLAVIPATPSELTIDWESFKRPGQREVIKPLVLASHRASGFEERQRRAKEAAGVNGKDSTSSGPGTSAGGGFQFRNQK